jgi:hypothetical protein
MRKPNSSLISVITVAALFSALLILQPYSPARLAGDNAPSLQAQAAASESNVVDGFNVSEANSIKDIDVQPVESMDKYEAEARLSEEAAAASNLKDGGGRVLLAGGLDHVAAGTATRNAGYGTIRLRGVPPGATTVRAYLYWGTVRTAPFGENATFNGNTVPGQLVGTAQNPCWGWTGSFAAFRADVTGFILPGINGDYRVTNLASNITDGRDPWRNYDNTLPLSEGASLVVIFSHPSVPTSARYYIYHGAHYFAGTLNVNHNFSPPIPTHTVLKHTRLGGDGQTGYGIKPFAFATDEKTYLGPTLSSLSQIRGRGAASRNYSSDWNGFDGQPLNQLWDTNTDEITGILSSGLNAYAVRYVSQGDCIVLVAQVLSAY